MAKYKVYLNPHNGEARAIKSSFYWNVLCAWLIGLFFIKLLSGSVVWEFCVDIEKSVMPPAEIFTFELLEKAVNLRNVDISRLPEGAQNTVSKIRASSRFIDTSLSWVILIFSIFMGFILPLSKNRKAVLVGFDEKVCVTASSEINAFNKAAEATKTSRTS